MIDRATIEKLVQLKDEAHAFDDEADELDQVLEAEKVRVLFERAVSKWAEIEDVLTAHNLEIILRLQWSIQAEEALRFYADEQRHAASPIPDAGVYCETSAILQDQGALARAAISKLKGGAS